MVEKINGSLVIPAPSRVCAQEGKRLILAEGDLEVILKDEHNVERQGNGLDLFTIAGNNRKEETTVVKLFSYSRANL